VTHAGPDVAGADIEAEGGIGTTDEARVGRSYLLNRSSHWLLRDGGTIRSPADGQDRVMAKRGANRKRVEPVQFALSPGSASPCRIRPDLNEWRYYRTKVWPDLSGRALLMRQ
jgi:hypothetical protein